MRDILYILIFAILLTLPGLSIAQDFSFTCDSLNQPGTLGGENVFSAILTNNTDDQNIIRLDVTDESIPEGWNYFWCLGLICLPPNTYSYTDTLGPNATDTVFVHIMPEEVEENGSITITAVPMVHATPQQALTFTVSFNDTEVPAEITTPMGFGLAKAYPNPFNPGTSINYSLIYSDRIEVVVYDQHGRSVITLHNGWQSAADYSLHWDGKDLNGINVPTGLYLVSLRTSTGSTTLRLVKIQ